MRKKIVVFGLSLLGLTGCTGEGYQWLSNVNVEIYENHHGVAYHALLAGGSVDGMRYSISGQDSSLFDVNAQTGEIQFKDSPDYEQPQDYNRDNSYKITVAGSDVSSGVEHSAIDVSIAVKDAERFKASKLFPLANSYLELNENGVVPLTVVVEDLDVPIFYPDDWQVTNQNVTQFFHYPLPFSDFEFNFSEDAFSNFLDPKWYSGLDAERIRYYYGRKFLQTFNMPMLMHYGYVVNPDEKITISYSFNNLQEGMPPVELEWQLRDQLVEQETGFIALPRQMALSKTAIYLASENALWRMNRDGGQLNLIYNAENATIEKLAVLNERVLMLLRDNVSQRRHLTEVDGDKALVYLYAIEGLSDEVLGTDYDVEILYIDSEYIAAFLPKETCQLNDEGIADSTMYRFNSMGQIPGTRLLTNVEGNLFKCRDGLLVGSNESYDLEYGSPRMSYNPAESSLYYWGQRYSEDQINGITMTGGPESITVGSEYWLDELTGEINDFQHFFRSFNERKSIYINDGGLHVANGHISDPAVRISSENYQVKKYAVDTSSDLIYSIGYWGGAQLPSLAVHHIYSGATSYIPLL